LGIKTGKFDRYRCPICFDGLIALSQQIRECATEDDRKLITKYHKHTKLFRQQFTLFSEQKECLPVNVLFLVYDYSTVHETAKFKLKDLNFTAY